MAQRHGITPGRIYYFKDHFALARSTHRLLQFEQDVVALGPVLLQVLQFLRGVGHSHEQFLHVIVLLQ